MSKKRLTIVLIVPLLLINIFNVVFILIRVQDTEYPEEALRIAGDYFLGLPLLLLVFSLIMILLIRIFTRRPSSLLYPVFLIFILFLMAINISLFPEINDRFGVGEYDFRWKHDASLDEAIAYSPAKITRFLKSYRKMNSFLERKILIVPPFNLLGRDEFFKVFITAGRWLEQDYVFELSEESFEKLNRHKPKQFLAYGKDTGIKEYLLVDEHPDSNRYYLYTFQETMILVPQELQRELFLNLHD